MLLNYIQSHTPKDANAKMKNAGFRKQISNSRLKISARLLSILEGNFLIA